MAMSTKMTWKGGLKFEGTGAYGNTLTTDASIKGGGEEVGFKPTELLLWGVAGCTGIDVVRILAKQRQELTALEIEVVGHLNDDYPKPFHTIEVKYLATGKNLDKSKLAKAIELSESKYCVVSQTIQQETKVTTSFEIKEG